MVRDKYFCSMNSYCIACYTRGLRITSLAGMGGQSMQIVYMKSLWMDHGYFTFVHKIIVDLNITQQGIFVQSSNVIWSLKNMSTHFAITNLLVAGCILFNHQWGKE